MVERGRLGVELNMRIGKMQSRCSAVGLESLGVGFKVEMKSEQN